MIFPEKGPNISNSKEIVSLITKYENVAGYINGHQNAGNYGKSGNCHCVNFKGMVETEAQTAYSTVTCFPDRIEKSRAWAWSWTAASAGRSAGAEVSDHLPGQSHG